MNNQAQEAGERECMEVATMLSEVDRRVAETKKDMYEFKRDVIGELALHACLYSHIVSEDGMLAAYSAVCTLQWVLKT